MTRPLNVLIALLIPAVARRADTTGAAAGSAEPVEHRSAGDPALGWPGAGRARDGGRRPADADHLSRRRGPRGPASSWRRAAGTGRWPWTTKGRQVAAYFNAMGVAAFVLKYRLGPSITTRSSLAMRSARCGWSARARRSTASTPTASGMMGFSAGGHLAATAGTRFDAGNASAHRSDRSRQQPARLPHPRLSGDHVRSRRDPRRSVRNLLGENPDPKLIELLSNELHVTPQTPPTFLFHTNADTGVVAENSMRFYLALRKAKVPAEMHIFENGPHGVGLALGDPALGQWPVLLTNWLRGRGLLTPCLTRPPDGYGILSALFIARGPHPRTPRGAPPHALPALASLAPVISGNKPSDQQSVWKLIQASSLYNHRRRAKRGLAGRGGGAPRRGPGVGPRPANKKCWKIATSRPSARLPPRLPPPNRLERVDQHQDVERQVVANRVRDAHLHRDRQRDGRARSAGVPRAGSRSDIARMSETELMTLSP